MATQRDLLIHLAKLNLDTAALCQRISDRIPTEPEVETLLDNGTQIFGERERFAAWLLAPNPYFHGLTPMVTLANGDLQPLKDELIRIEHGELIA